MNESVIIIGASGHGKVIADIIEKSGDIVEGFLDDDANLPETIVGFPILGCIDNYKKYQNSKFVIAIGNASLRKQIAEKLQGVFWYTAIHPSATIAGIEVEIEEGTVIMANVVINPCTHIGKHSIINSGAIVEHDNILEDYVHVSVGAKLAGTVRVGEATWIGVGATVNNNIDICSECMIGAGAVVVNNIETKGTYIGIPARMLK